MSDVAGQLLLQLILILLNAFFAATEIAVISLNDKKLKARAEEGDKKAERMLKMVEEPTQFLSTIQIGITLAGFLGSAFAADNFAQRLSDAAVRLFHLSEAHAGTLDENNIRYIKNVFKLDGMTAEDVMTPRSAMAMIPSDASDAEILKVIEEENYSRIPVYDEGSGHVVGVLQAGEYLLKHQRDGFTLKDAMAHPVFAPTSAHLDVLFKGMQKEHNHLTVVINEFGETAGVVTMEDILEEIVGEIWDERDEAVEEIVPAGENTYRVRCTASLETFFSFFSAEEDSKTEASTVNGWITEKTGSIPEKGTSFRYGDLKITVTEADGFMAKEAQVRVLRPDRKE